jgi:hypothetical protein
MHRIIWLDVYIIYATKDRISYIHKIGMHKVIWLDVYIIYATKDEQIEWKYHIYIYIRMCISLMLKKIYPFYHCYHLYQIEFEL